MSYHRQTEDSQMLMPDYLYDVLDLLDELHSAASDGDAEQATSMEPDELVNLLRDMIYTAQQTIDEVESRRVVRKPILHLLPRKEKIG